jgi:hypothetical protein
MCENRRGGGGILPFTCPLIVQSNYLADSHYQVWKDESNWYQIMTIRLLN